MGFDETSQNARVVRRKHFGISGLKLHARNSQNSKNAEKVSEFCSMDSLE